MQPKVKSQSLCPASPYPQAAAAQQAALQSSLVPIPFWWGMQGKIWCKTGIWERISTCCCHCPCARLTSASHCAVSHSNVRAELSAWTFATVTSAGSWIAADTGFCNNFTGGEENVVFAKISNYCEEIGFFFFFFYSLMVATPHQQTVGMGRWNEKGVES